MSVNGTREERLSPSHKTAEKHPGDKDSKAAQGACEADRAWKASPRGEVVSER